MGDVLRLPFKDGTAERIEAFHVIEHFDLVHCRYLLAEWFRVMADGGSMVIETPDLEETLRKFVKSEPDAQRRTIQWMFGIDSPGLGHKTGFTRGLLADILKEAGFTDVTWRRQETHRYEEGMRVECRSTHPTTRSRLNSAFRTRMLIWCKELDSYALIPMEDAISRAIEAAPEDGAMRIDEITRATASLVIRNPCAASAYVAAVRDLDLGDDDELAALADAVDQLVRDRVHHRVFATWMISRKELPIDVQFDRFMESMEDDVAHALMKDDDGGMALKYLMSKEPVEIDALTLELVRCHANTHLGIGIRQLELGRVDVAGEHLRLACNIDPSNHQAHWNLGRVLAGSEKTRGTAVKELEVALSLTTHKGDRASIKEDLERIGTE